MLSECMGSTKRKYAFDIRHKIEKKENPIEKNMIQSGPNLLTEEMLESRACSPCR